MGNGLKSNENNVLRRVTKENSDVCKPVVDYTNRRKIQIMPSENAKSSEERRKENEEEFEYLRLQLGALSLSNVCTNKQLAPQKSCSGSTISSSSSKHPEIEEFQKFLDKHGGRYGGWKEKDHLFFLKIRNKYPLKKTAEIVNKNFPDISIEKVLVHETWYIEYLSLRAAKKKAIEEWKTTQKAIQIVEEQKCDPKPQPETKPEMKRDPKLKEKIEVWKAHCIASKLEKEEQKRQEETRKKRVEEERMKIQEEKRALVNRYREEKVSLDMALRTAKETEQLKAKKEAALHAALMLKYFRYEDRMFTERQKARKQPPAKDEPKVRSAIEAKRDPNRLLQPTLGWIYHVKKTGEEHPVNFSPLDVKHISKLKKPDWRKGLQS